MKKLIGLIPLYDDDKDSYWMLPGYMKVLEACGALPVMLPLTTDHAELDDCFKLCDGILMTGGHDVGPALYAETAKKTCGIPCSSRDKMEAYLFEIALQEDKPVFGICRGVQLMNVLLGGTLYQDLPTEHPSKTEHHMASPYGLFGMKPRTQREIAKQLGISRSYVSRIEKRAIKKLGEHLKAE